MRCDAILYSLSPSRKITHSEMQWWVGNPWGYNLNNTFSFLWRVFSSLCMSHPYFQIKPHRSQRRSNKQPVRLSFQPLIFSQLAMFFSHINQSTVLSVAYFQAKRTRRRITPSTMENGVANPGQGGGRRVLHYSTPIWNSFPFPSGHLFCCLGVEGTAGSSSVVPCNQLSCPARQPRSERWRHRCRPLHKTNPVPTWITSHHIKFAWILRKFLHRLCLVALKRLKSIL
jgi:hypothetical protein